MKQDPEVLTGKEACLKLRIKSRNTLAKYIKYKGLPRVPGIRLVRIRSVDLDAWLARMDQSK